MGNFAAEMRALMADRGISGNALARQVYVDAALISRYRTGKQRPSERLATLIDGALGADGELAALASAGPDRRSVLAGGLLAGAWLGISADVSDRLDWVAQHPPAADTAAVVSLADVLAAQRRTEDALGSAAMLGPVMAQLSVVEDLAAGARGPLRSAVIDIAGQWSQFAAHLHISLRDFAGARALCRQALELAVEAGDATMTTTILRLRAYMAWLADEPGPAIGLAQAAQRDARAAPSERAYGAMLEASGHAVTGDAAAAERNLGIAMTLAAEMTSRPERERPWSYWYTPEWFGCQRGVVLGYLADSDRRRADAIKALTTGYTGLRPDAASSEWGTDYIVHRAAIHARGGDVGQAVADAMQAVPVARRTRSASLQGMLTQLHTGLAGRWPDDPRVAELADALA
jgi:transcriptional regulator with XRE-family HTH domain